MNSLNHQNANQNGNSGRRNFLRNSAIGVMSGLCAAKVAATSATAQERIALCTPEQTDVTYAAMYAEIAQTATGRQSLSASEIDELAGQMNDDVESLAELKPILFKFYSLNAPSLEAVLQKMRTGTAENARWKIIQCTPCYTDEMEQAARITVGQLNQQSLQETGLPYHLAILRGWIPPSERRSVAGRLQAPVNTTASCPTAYYPMAVGQYLSFFKIQVAMATIDVQQPGDTVCNINLGPFPNTIKGWVASSPKVHGAVWTHGFGGKLQSNGNSLYLKKWITDTFGLTPTLKYQLLTRRY